MKVKHSNLFRHYVSRLMIDSRYGPRRAYKQASYLIKKAGWDEHILRGKRG